MELDFYGANKGHNVVPCPVENPDDMVYDKELNYENDKVFKTKQDTGRCPFVASG